MKANQTNSSKNKSINFWALLGEKGICYGKDVVMVDDIRDFKTVRVLEFRGKFYNTASEIYADVNK